MFNRKLHIILTILFVLLGTSVTLDGETFSILSLLGIKDRTIYGFYAAFLWVVAISVLFFILYRYRKVSCDFYTSLFHADYERARTLAEKYFTQNKSLFFNQRVFFAFAIKDEKALKAIRKKSIQNSKRETVCDSYLFLLDFVNGKQSALSLDALIEKNTHMKKNETILSLLQAIKSYLQDDFFLAESFCEKIPTKYYPCVNEIVALIQKREK